MALDTGYAKSRVEAIRRQVAGPPDERTDELTDEDRDILIEFDEGVSRDRKRNNRCGWYHHKNLLTRLFVFAIETDSLADSLKDGEHGEKALDRILDWIHGQDYSGYTVQGYLSTLRVFADTVCDDVPERFDEIEPGEHVDEDLAPLPSNVIEFADMIAMVEEVDMLRDKALISTQWDGGFRPMEELYTLQRKNITLGEDHILITLPTNDGKTDRREILILSAAPYLRKWITEEHPVHDDPEDSMGPETFIWVKENENELPRYNTIAERFRVAGERAGLEKDHSAQHLRRSSASILAGQPHISERDLRKRFSWAKGSLAPEHYIAAFSTDTQVSVARCRGRDVEGIEEKPDTASVPCTQCGRWTMRGVEECVWCSHNIDPDQQTFQPTMADPRTAGKKSLKEMILDGEVTHDELKTLQKLEHEIKTNQDLFDELDQLMAKAKALEDDSNWSGRVGSALGIPGAVAWASATAGGIAKRTAEVKHAALSLHPGFEDYPPKGPRLAKVVAVQTLWTATFVGMLAANGSLTRLMNGNVLEWAVAILGLSLGTLMVARAIPTPEEAVDARFGVE